MNEYLENPTACPHDWLPVSMVFETQLLDSQGRVLTRQPALLAGRVYVVCLGCAQHTYIETSWANFRLEGSMDRESGDVLR